MNRPGAPLALLLLVLGMLAPAAAAPADKLVVGEFRDSLPPGWEVQVRVGQPRFRVAEGALHLVSQKDTYGLKREIKVDLKQYPFLNWRWKATLLPAGGDGRRSATDDQAAQVYVVFPRWPLALRSQLIGYTWENLVPRGTSYTSPARGLTRYVVLRDRSDSLGQWVSERRNVAEDYRLLFGAEPPEAGAVSLYINTQHTGTAAESAIADVYFSRN
jgi:hypothetical protein